MKRVRWKLIALSATGVLVWTMGAIAVYEKFFRIRTIKVHSNGTIEYLVGCPSVEKQ